MALQSLLITWARFQNSQLYSSVSCHVLSAQTPLYQLESLQTIKSIQFCYIIQHFSLPGIRKLEILEELIQKELSQTQLATFLSNSLFGFVIITDSDGSKSFVSEMIDLLVLSSFYVCCVENLFYICIFLEIHMRAIKE